MNFLSSVKFKKNILREANIMIFFLAVIFITVITV